MQIQKNYLKTFRRKQYTENEGMGWCVLSIVVHSEILFQVNFKFYLKSTLNPILFLNANHEIAINYFNLGRGNS